ncbi:TPA: T3SS effector protein NleH [Escherichia albertii]|nr:T3SS effector protein NleH [Escherichia albertii]
MLSSTFINLGCSWNSFTRNLSTPDSSALSLVKYTAVHSDNGTSVKVGNRTYRVVVTDNKFSVSRESNSGCFTTLLQKLGWPRGEITRKIEAMLNTSPVSIREEREPLRSEVPDLPPVDYMQPELPPVDYGKSPITGNVIGKGGNSIIYEDITDRTKVLKMFTIPQTPEEVANEVGCFNKYYGAGSSEKIFSDNGDIIGIRMNKINGESVLEIQSLPPQAEQAIYDMFERLEQSGILFVDTTETNILYNHAKNEFFPIDISSYNLLGSEEFGKREHIMSAYLCGKNYLINTVLGKIF